MTGAVLAIQRRIFGGASVSSPSTSPLRSNGIGSPGRYAPVPARYTGG